MLCGGKPGEGLKETRLEEEHKADLQTGREAAAEHGGGSLPDHPCVSGR